MQQTEDAQNVLLMTDFEKVEVIRKIIHNALKRDSSLSDKEVLEEVYGLLGARFTRTSFGNSAGSKLRMD